MRGEDFIRGGRVGGKVLEGKGGKEGKDLRGWGEQRSSHILGGRKRGEKILEGERWEKIFGRKIPGKEKALRGKGGKGS